MSVFPINRVHDILRRLEDNTAQPEALKTCFGILAIMSREETNKLMIARDGMEIILTAMTAHVDKSDVQEAGCDLLWSLSFNNNIVKDLIAKHGGATVLVRALKRHCRSADFLKSACGALSNMCQSKLNQDGVASQGGLQPLVGSIHAHQSNGKLLPFVFDALASLIVSNEDNARMVSSLGIIPLIVTSLGRHQHALEVVKSGCHALAILSDVKGQASKIAYAGGVAAILPLLNSHPSYADLHRVAAVVLLRMLQESTHVSREIACHEGVRILLMSLEKGGAQQDTVAAVTHILYSVTNPNAPSAGLIESQLWLPVASDGASPATGGVNGRALEKSNSNFAQSAQTNNAGNSSNTALVGLLLMLNQYTDRKDVVRASCRLLNNLVGYSGVIAALNKLAVMEVIFTCVSKHHNETKDVAESASALLKTINRRSEVNIDVKKTECLNGILIIMQTRVNDEEVVAACGDILTQLVLAGFRGEKSNQAVLEFKVSDGRMWEFVALECVVNAMEGCTMLEINYARTGGSTEGSNSAVTLPDNGALAVSSSRAAMGQVPGSGKLAMVVKRYQWSKQTVRFVGSLLQFLEALHSTGKCTSWSLMNKDTVEALANMRDIVPTKHVDIVKRIEALLGLLAPSGIGAGGHTVESDVTKGLKKTFSKQGGLVMGSGVVEKTEESQSASSSKSGRNTGGDNHSRNSANDASTSGNSRSVAGGVSKSSSSTSIPKVMPARVWRYEDEDDSTGFTTRDKGGPPPKLYPLHPLKYPGLSGGVTQLVDNWPNHAERLLPTPGGGRIFAANTQGLSLDRMHVVYESSSAAGKGLHSRLGNVMPYDVAPDGIGEPFEHSVTFDSEFESGNLYQAVQRGDANYDLFLRSDLHTMGHTQWFYFAVSNTHPPALVRLAEQGVQVPPVRVRFNIVNLTKPDSLFNLGMRPVVYSCWDALSTGTGWIRSGTDIAYYVNPHVRNNSSGEGVSNYYTLSFTLEFHNAQDTYLIAYSYPYTHTDYKTHMAKLMERPGINHIMRQYRLCQTLGGNDCNLVVITNFKEASEKIGPLTMGQINGTEPDNNSSNKSRRSMGGLSGGSGNSANIGFGGRVSLKPALFFSCRVHPGEVPASWMMKGMLDFLTSHCIQAQLLRQSFVIFICPILNPDGVIYGNNRCSLAGVDLNRQWKVTNKALHPTIAHFKSFMLAQYKIREIVSYIDLHGHSRKYNVFLYGCDIKNRTKQQVRAFPKFFSQHSLGRKYVCYEDCSFQVKKGRESTARVVIAKELNIGCCYTLEATFCGSNYGPLKFCHMNIGHMQEVGAALCDALLHFCIANGQITKDSLPPQMIESMYTLQQQMVQQQQDAASEEAESSPSPASSSSAYQMDTYTHPNVIGGTNTGGARSMSPQVILNKAGALKANASAAGGIAAKLDDPSSSSSLASSGKKASSSLFSPAAVSNSTAASAAAMPTGGTSAAPSKESAAIATPTPSTIAAAAVEDCSDGGDNDDDDDRSTAGGGSGAAAAGEKKKRRVASKPSGSLKKGAAKSRKGLKLRASEDANAAKAAERARERDASRAAEQDVATQGDDVDSGSDVDAGEEENAAAAASATLVATGHPDGVNCGDIAVIGPGECDSNGEEEEGYCSGAAVDSGSETDSVVAMSSDMNAQTASAAAAMKNTANISRTAGTDKLLPMPPIHKSTAPPVGGSSQQQSASSSFQLPVSGIAESTSSTFSLDNQGDSLSRTVDASNTGTGTGSGNGNCNGNGNGSSSYTLLSSQFGANSYSHAGNVGNSNNSLSSMGDSEDRYVSTTIYYSVFSCSIGSADTSIGCNYHVYVLYCCRGRGASSDKERDRMPSISHGDPGTVSDDSRENGVRVPYVPMTEDLSSTSISSVNSPRNSFSGGGNSSSGGKVTPLIGNRKYLQRNSSNIMTGGTSTSTTGPLISTDNNFVTAGDRNTGGSTTPSALLPHSAGNQASANNSSGQQAQRKVGGCTLSCTLSCAVLGGVLFQFLIYAACAYSFSLLEICKFTVTMECYPRLAR